MVEMRSGSKLWNHAAMTPRRSSQIHVPKTARANVKHPSFPSKNTVSSDISDLDLRDLRLLVMKVTTLMKMAHRMKKAPWMMIATPMMLSILDDAYTVADRYEYGDDNPESDDGEIEAVGKNTKRVDGNLESLVIEECSVDGTNPSLVGTEEVNVDVIV
jgi:hypothetical protein